MKRGRGSRKRMHGDEKRVWTKTKEQTHIILPIRVDDDERRARKMKIRRHRRRTEEEEVGSLKTEANNGERIKIRRKKRIGSNQ